MQWSGQPSQLVCSLLVPTHIGSQHSNLTLSHAHQTGSALVELLQVLRWSPSKLVELTMAVDFWTLWWVLLHAPLLTSCPLPHWLLGAIIVFFHCCCLFFVKNAVTLPSVCVFFGFLCNFVPGSTWHHFEVFWKWSATNAMMLMDGGDSMNFSSLVDDEANGVSICWWIVVCGW